MQVSASARECQLSAEYYKRPSWTQSESFTEIRNKNFDIILVDLEQ